MTPIAVRWGSSVTLCASVAVKTAGLAARETAFDTSPGTLVSVFLDSFQSCEGTSSVSSVQTIQHHLE